MSKSTHVHCYRVTSPGTWVGEKYNVADSTLDYPTLLLRMLILPDYDSQPFRKYGHLTRVHVSRLTPLALLEL